MTLERLPNETDIQYHQRLIYGKLVDKTLGDVDYTELAPYVYGQEYSADVARRMMYGSCRTLQLVGDAALNTQAEAPVSCCDDIIKRTAELRKERQKLFDERAAYNKVVRDRAREEELNDIIADAIAKNNLPELPTMDVLYKPRNGANDLIVSLNDIHYGAVVDNYWCKYNSVVCREMMARYAEAIIDIGKTHRSEACYVCCNGDCISGNIHYRIAIANNENLMEQVMGVSELIARFLSVLSMEFNTVVFTSVSGNHSRIDQKDRALSGERLDNLIAWYLKARLQNSCNIVINNAGRLDDTMYLLNVRGRNYIGVHGDYDLSASSARELSDMIDEPVYAVLSAHVHHNNTDVSHGVRVFTSGSFLGTDDYCVSKRLRSAPEQMVCVADASGVRCIYNVPLDDGGVDK